MFRPEMAIVRFLYRLTLNLLTTTIVAPPSNASKWQMGFNSAFKGLRGFYILVWGVLMWRSLRVIPCLLCIFAQ